jgi:hypothetical protein
MERKETDVEVLLTGTLYTFLLGGPRDGQMENKLYESFSNRAVSGYFRSVC